MYLLKVVLETNPVDLICLSNLLTNSVPTEGCSETNPVDLICLSNLLTNSVPTEGCSGNESCGLNLSFQSFD